MVQVLEDRKNVMVIVIEAGRFEDVYFMNQIEYNDTWGKEVKESKEKPDTDMFVFDLHKFKLNLKT